MAGKSVSKVVKKYPGVPFRAPIKKEEQVLLMMYRQLSRWERNWFFMIIQSLVWGRLVPKAAGEMTWEQVSSRTGLPKARKAVCHG